jgi:hypothetical protein
MSIRELLGERSYTVADIANLQKGLESIRGLVTARAITRDKGELAVAQCTEELKRLTERLADIDGSISLLQARAVA